MPWVWLTHAAHTGRKSYPAVGAEGEITYRRGSAEQDDRIEQCFNMKRRNASSSHRGTLLSVEHSWAKVQLTLCAANVMTLHPGFLNRRACDSEAATLAVSSREAWLLHQFKEIGANFVGVLETRARFDLQRSQDGWYTLSTKSNSGHGGVAFWASLVKPYAWDTTGAPQYIRPQDVRLALATPEVAIARVNAKYLRALFIVAHAPTSASSHDEYDVFWQQVKKCVATFDPSWQVFVLTDSNATIGFEEHSLYPRNCGDHQ